MTNHWPIEQASRIWVTGRNARVKQKLTALLDGMVRPPTGLLDHAFIAADSMDEALYFIQKVTPRVTADGRIWLLFPNESQTEFDRASFTKAYADHRIPAEFTPGEEQTINQSLQAIVLRRTGRTNCTVQN